MVSRGGRDGMSGKLCDIAFDNSHGMIIFVFYSSFFYFHVVADAVGMVVILFVYLVWLAM